MERHLIIDHQKFSYEGLFNTSELYTVISSFFFDKGWDWYEKLNQEQVTSDGKQLYIVFEPWKNVSDYYKLKIKIKLIGTDIKDVEIDKEGKTIRINQGLIRMTMDGYIFSDRSDKWNEKPFYWFLSYILEKYFFKSHFAKFEAWLTSDADDLMHKIKTYLNTYKYTYQQ